jgi:hypothetical protein
MSRGLNLVTMTYRTANLRMAYAHVVVQAAVLVGGHGKAPMTVGLARDQGSAGVCRREIVHGSEN